MVKLMSCFQVQELSHCDTVVSVDPALNGNLNATINFLGQQLATAKLKNGVLDRSLSVVETNPKDDLIEEDVTEGTDSADDEGEDTMESLRKQLKTVQEKLARLKETKAARKSVEIKALSSGDKEPPHKKPKAEAQDKSTVASLHRVPPSLLKSPPLKSFIISQRSLAYAKKN